MSAYGGYTKPAYGAQGGDDSGGFFAGGSQQGSQGGGGKSYQDESLRPVTIKQILDAEEAYSGADFKIDGQPITQLTFVGQVRSVNPQPTNITFRIDDGTGIVEVKKWIDVDKQDAAEPGYEVGTYLRIWGRLKSFSNKRHVGAHVIRPVIAYDEINYHLLEATYVHLYLTRGPLGQQGGAGGADGDSMFVDQQGGGAGAGSNPAPNKLANCSPMARKMFNFMNSGGVTNEGVNLNIFTTQAGMGVNDVLGAADELLGQGLIYTTADDETWAILEY